MPLLLIVGLIVLLIVAANWYESRFGSEGPFKNIHQH